MADPRCSEAECSQQVIARGLCRKHYLAAWRAGGQLPASSCRAMQKLLCPPEHPHDADTCWVEHGCRCARCAHARHMERQRRRYRLRAYGRENQIVGERADAGPVRERLLELRDSGFGLERVADAADVPRGSVMDIMYGRRGAAREHEKTKRAARTTKAEFAERILALDPDDIDPAMLTNLGTTRRIQALIAMGHTQTELARRFNMRPSNFHKLAFGKRPRVSANTAALAVATFAELWAVRPEGARADNARALAAKYRWLSPLAWDDIDTDREPRFVDNTDQIDEVAVELAVSGERIRLSHAERQEAIRRLHALHWSDSRIAAQLHLAARTVWRNRQDLGLAAVVGADNELIVA